MLEKPWLAPGRLFFFLSCTNGHRKHSFHHIGDPFLALYAAFSPEEHSLVRGS